MNLKSASSRRRRILDSLSLEQKVGQMMMTGVSGTSLTHRETGHLKAGGAGFVSLFLRNFSTIESVTALTNSIHQCGEIPPMIWADQEGGNVVQFGESSATAISAMGLAATGQVSCARKAGRIIGLEMNAIGVDGVFAPVLDVNTIPDNPIIGIRSFGEKPEDVARFGAAFARGLREGGVAGCGKHYPGHGGVVLDSHREVPRCNLTQAEMTAIHLFPFAHLQRNELLDVIMTAHVIYPAIAAEIATFSRYWLQTNLRSFIGFRGVLMTDCLEMGAITREMDPEEAAVKAVDAGADVLTASRSLDFQLRLREGLLRAVNSGRIPESRIHRSVERIIRLKMDHGILPVAPKREIKRAESVSRSHRSEEERLAEASITVVRDRDETIPIKKETRLLVVEWEKVVATEALSQGEPRSVLEGPLKKFFPNAESIMLGLDGHWPEGLDGRLVAAERILAAVFSRFPEVEVIQQRFIQRLLTIRPDTLVAALGNPYDLRGFPSLRTYVVTYGYRRVQMEALLKVLRGDIPAGGKLPVSIPLPEISQ